MATRIEIADSIFSCIDELRHPTYPTGPTARNSTDARTVATGFQGYGLSILEQCEEFRHDWRHVCRDRVCDWRGKYPSQFSPTWLEIMWRSPHGLPQLRDGRILVPREEWSEERNSSGVHNGWNSRFEGRASGGSDRLRWFCDFQRGHRVLSEDAVWKLAQWAKTGLYE